MKQSPELITWVDSHGIEDGAWGRVDEWESLLAPEEFNISTVGYVVAEGAGFLLVVQSIQWNDHNKAMGALVIPTGCVVSRERLRRG